LKRPPLLRGTQRCNVVATEEVSHRLVWSARELSTRESEQIELNPRVRGPTAKRAALWCLREIETLRRTLIQCAGRIIRPAGKLNTGRRRAGQLLLDWSERCLMTQDCAGAPALPSDSC
jgi:hypothetical protein